MRNADIMDQAYVKYHNIERLLSILEGCQPVSRTELTRLSELSSASVTRIVGALASLGLVKEVSLTETGGNGRRRGRRAVNLCTCADGIYTLGCHIDTQCLRLCLLDFHNQSRASGEIALCADDLYPERLAELIRCRFSRMASDRVNVRCVGVSLSGQIDRDSGRVVRSQALDWTAVDLAAPLSSALGFPVHIENDVNACLIWECMQRGLLRGGQDAAYLYLGHAGIGFANTVAGKLVRGLNNAAGEIEDVVLSLNERLKDHLMEVSLVSRARLMAPSVSDMGDILDAYRMELPWARVLMDDFIGHLNIILQLIRAMLDPHCIILGGDIPVILQGCPELLPGGDYTFGERFENSCAMGAAVIAMREALRTLITSAMSPERPHSPTPIPEEE